MIFKRTFFSAALLDNMKVELRLNHVCSYCGSWHGCPKGAICYMPVATPCPLCLAEESAPITEGAMIARIRERLLAMIADQMSFYRSDLEWWYEMESFQDALETIRALRKETLWNMPKRTKYYRHADGNLYPIPTLPRLAKLKP